MSMITKLYASSERIVALRIALNVLTDCGVRKLSTAFTSAPASREYRCRMKSPIDGLKRSRVVLELLLTRRVNSDPVRCLIVLMKSKLPFKWGHCSTYLV